MNENEYRRGTIARIRVESGDLTEYPVAERVGDGWQTGFHHYPDKAVAGVLAVYVHQGQDHVAAAASGLNDARQDVSQNYVHNTGEFKADVLSAALVHATLAVAEQQRVANLIAWHGYVADQGDLPDHASELSQQIHEALGVSA